MTSSQTSGQWAQCPPEAAKPEEELRTAALLYAYVSHDAFLIPVT